MNKTNDNGGGNGGAGATRSELERVGDNLPADWLSETRIKGRSVGILNLTELRAAIYIVISQLSETQRKLDAVKGLLKEAL